MTYVPDFIIGLFEDKDSNVLALLSALLEHLKKKKSTLRFRVHWYILDRLFQQDFVDTGVFPRHGNLKIDVTETSTAAFENLRSSLQGAR